MIGLSRSSLPPCLPASLPQSSPPLFHTHFSPCDAFIHSVRVSDVIKCISLNDVAVMIDLS